MYVDIEDKDNIAVVDAKTLKVTAHYDLAGKGGGCAGLALDVKNHILFASCRNPPTMVILNADDGKIITTLPIGTGTDGAASIPRPWKPSARSGDGTLTIIKENSPTSFVVEQNREDHAARQDADARQQDGPHPADRRRVRPAAGPARQRPRGRTKKGGRGRGGRAPMLPDSFSIVLVGK